MDTHSAIFAEKKVSVGFVDWLNRLYLKARHIMNVFMEELRATDFPMVKGWIDPAISRIFTAPIDESQLARLLTNYRDETLTDIGKKALDMDTGQCVGFVHAVINSKDNHAHIQQIAVAPEIRHRGYGAAILRNFLDICFLEHGFHRVQLLTGEKNHAAIACYKKVGFQVDGLLRDFSMHAGDYMSEYFFSILDHEWQSIRTQRATGISDDNQK